METPEKTGAFINNLTPIKTAALQSPNSPQNITITNRVTEIGNILENNYRQWVILQQQDLQLVNSLIRLSDKPKDDDPEKLNEFYERMETQSTKISSILSEYKNVLSIQSKCLSDFEGLRKLGEMAKDFQWKSWTLDQLCRRNRHLLDAMKEEYEAKALSYKNLPHCYDKAEFELYRTLLKYPDKRINFQFLANSVSDAGKGNLLDHKYQLSPR